MIVKLCKYSLATVSVSLLSFFSITYLIMKNFLTEATIQPLLKKGGVIQPDNYCVVSLLNIHILGHCVCVFKT